MRYLEEKMTYPQILLFQIKLGRTVAKSKTTYCDFYVNKSQLNFLYVNILNSNVQGLPDVSSLLGLRIPLQHTLLKVGGPGVVGELLRNGSEYTLHHGKVLLATVGVEQHEPECELEYYASDRPNVTRMIPTSKMFKNFIC